MTLEQTQYLSDHPQYKDASPLSDGSLLVRLGDGAMTKVDSHAIIGNSYRKQAYAKSQQDNPNLQGGNKYQEETLRQIEPKKIENMLNTIKSSNLSGGTVPTVEQVKSSPELFEKIYNQYSDIVAG